MRLSAQNDNSTVDRNWFLEWLFGSDNGNTWKRSVTDNDEDMQLKTNLSHHWQFSIGDNKKWASPLYNDANWEKIYVPSNWEDEGFNGYDGYAWYRIHFDGRELNQKDAYFLHLGFVDDVDETYLNGALVGKSGTFPPRFRTAYDSNRKYYLPNDAINFEGDNVLAVRVYDITLDGGIRNGDPGIYTYRNNESLLQPLYGAWKFIPASSNSYSKTDYDDAQWESLVVPSYWDNQGYRSFDGIAWYRKTFNVDFTPDINKVYYLVLGKIDDFDITYLNGVEIGTTNDERSMNQSGSYHKIRAYAIPEGLLNSKAQNVIAVMVEDIGKEGGIYKGPIGIVEESTLTRIIRDY
jgi:sialate O-acetylesterase